MGKKHDNWVTDLVGGTTAVEMGWGDDSVVVSDGEGGTAIAFKHEWSVNLFRSNFKVWVIPCYTKGDLKAAIEVGATKTEKTKAVSSAISAGGALELGIGGTSEAVTGGPYLEAALVASQTATITHDDAYDWSDPNGWTSEPFNIVIHGTGKMGVKIEIKDGPKLNEEQQIVKWELFIVFCGRFTSGKFDSVVCKPGKDLQRAIAWLQSTGTKVADFVEKYAPESVKKAAEDAAKWAAEGKGSKEIADQTQKTIDYVQKKTGVNIGPSVEKVVQSLVDPGGETSYEATVRVQEELARFSASVDDLHAVMNAAGLNGELKSQTAKDSEEYNAIIEVWRGEAETAAFGGSPAGAWKPMVLDLAARRRARKQAVEAEKAAKKKKETDEAERALLEQAKKAIGVMDKAAELAIGQGNFLNNGTSKNPEAHPQARKYLVDGQKLFFPAQSLRQTVAGLPPKEQISAAQKATALYTKAAEIFTTGIHHI